MSNQTSSSINEVDYKILEATRATELEHKVIEHLKVGWRLTGGCSITKCEHEWGPMYIYVQAVFKVAK